MNGAPLSYSPHTYHPQSSYSFLLTEIHLYRIVKIDTYALALL
jgi:hypothetical protein